MLSPFDDFLNTPLKINQLLSKKNILVKLGLLVLISGDPNFNLRLKMTKIASEWFLTSFERRFRFSSTTRRSRDRRGRCSNTPPPPARALSTMLTAGAIAPAVEQIASPVTGICSRSENLNLYVNYPLTAWRAYHAPPPRPE